MQAENTVLTTTTVNSVNYQDDYKEVDAVPAGSALLRSSKRHRAHRRRGRCGAGPRHARLAAPEAAATLFV